MVFRCMSRNSHIIVKFSEDCATFGRAVPRFCLARRRAARREFCGYDFLCFLCLSWLSNMYFFMYSFLGIDNFLLISEPEQF